jgi:hypothetical protein
VPPLPAQPPQFPSSVFVSTQVPLHSCWPSGQSFWHMPETHSSPTAHTFVQLPQWFGSPCIAVRFTHAPLQFTVPAGHCVTQLLLLHTWFAAQVVVQLPQWFGSLVVFAQSPLHSVSVGSHVLAHVPPLQTAVAPLHTVVHEPQCVLSVSVSTQTPLQAVSPGPQQMPLVHVSPEAHATPPAPAQPPQFASSVCGSEHEPPQLFWLAVQHATIVPVVGGLHD